MLLDNISKLCNVILILNTADRNKLLIHLLIEVGILIKNISNTATHTCGKVFASLSKDNNSTTSHIFTAVVADTLSNSDCTRVSYAEAFTSNTADKCLTTCCTIMCDITDNDIFISFEVRTLWRINFKLTTRKTLTEVIVAIAFKFKC